MEVARQLSWNDLSIYTARRMKAAVALADVAEAIREDETLGDQCSEFLHWFDFLVEGDPSVFTSLWSEPYAYHWSRTAGERLQEWRAGECRVEPLIAHLDLIKLFAIGMAIMQGSDISFVNPFELVAPIAIPGTNITLECEQPIVIESIQSGCLALQQSNGVILVPSDPKQSFSHPDVTREYCPVIRLDNDATIRLHPAAIKLPSCEKQNSHHRLPDHSLQHEYSESVEDAVALINQHLSTAYPQLGYAAKIIVVKSSADGGVRNSSSSRMPGALQMCGSRCGYQLAEDIIHESFHNRLYAIEETSDFFHNDRIHSTNENRFYSPWRNDPRPLYGVFHAVYVFSRVQQFWLNVLRASCTPEAQREFAAQRCGTLNLQLVRGLAELEANAEFTPLGQKIFSTLKQDIKEMELEIAALKLSVDLTRLEIDEEGEIVPSNGCLSGVPVSVQQSIDEHMQLFDQNAKMAGSV